mgnify:CR=1 FL=1
MEGQLEGLARVAVHERPHLEVALELRLQVRLLAVVGHEVVVMGCWGQRGPGCQDGWC